MRSLFYSSIYLLYTLLPLTCAAEQRPNAAPIVVLVVLVYSLLALIGFCLRNLTNKYREAAAAAFVCENDCVPVVCVCVFFNTTLSIAVSITLLQLTAITFDKCINSNPMLMLPWLENIEMEIYRSVLFCERLRLVGAVTFSLCPKNSSVWCIFKNCSGG